MKLDIAIVAHDKRREMAEKLADKVGASTIVWDDGKGPRETHERAWVELYENTPQTFRHHHWAMVIEDDAIPAHPFRRCMEAALTRAPTTVVSAYLGRGRPANWQHPIAQVMASRCDWLIARAVLHGVGLAVRGDRLTDMLIATRGQIKSVAARWAHPMDEAMDAWVRDAKIGVSYTHPSLLDHDPDLPSLIGPDRERTHTVAVPEILGAHLDPDYRKAWWFEAKERWGDSSVIIPTPEIPQV